MRAAYIVDLPGHFGPISASGLWAVVSRYGIDKLYLDIRQAQMSDLDYITSRLGSNGSGVMVDPIQWWGKTGADAAERTEQELLRIGFSGTQAAKPCSVMFDYEHHSADEINALIAQYRWHRYKRDTQLTIEPLQGGWFGPGCADTVNNDPNLVVLAQTYRSRMEPVAQDACRKDLERNGIRAERVKLYYGAFWRDAAGADHLIPPCEAADGCFWTLDKLYVL
jgi:hypothetical protein